IAADPLAAARDAAGRLQAVVVLKGAETVVVTPDGQAWLNAEGDLGLGTAGSGDVLSGVMAGFLARGAAPATAAIWAVWTHGEAGRRLSARYGGPGYLAREIAGELPAILAELA
ncbi:MAG TPA: NAD(P)H-hydrate dehydratase, partial [Phenylobacterium sp.]|nr:NAD(P)H-hydrate dehydratase [Phenylobacterium sp.]